MSNKLAPSVRPADAKVNGVVYAANEGAIPSGAAKLTCEPVEDPRAHDFKGWVTFDEGRGGTTVCTRSL